MATVAPLPATAAHNLSQSSRLESAGLQTPKPTESYVQSGNVTASLKFFSPPEDGSVPFNYVETPPAGQPQRNYADYDIDVQIHDIRGEESKYNLDDHAFAVIQNVPDSAEKDFTSDESIKKNYYPELEKLILDNIPGSTKVVFFDHTIRRVRPDSTRTPVVRVHIDQTASASKGRVIRHTGEEAEKLLQGRYRIVNVWRPLNGPVASFPLAFAASSTVESSDLIPIEHRYPTHTGEVAGVQYNSGQEWHYLSGMKDNERLLLECFDSESLKDDSTVSGGRVPHTAFVDPRTVEGAPGRESIEVRTLVFGPWNFQLRIAME